MPEDQVAGELSASKSASNPFPFAPNDPWPPNYVAVYGWRQRQVLKFRAQPSLIIGALEYYKTRPIEFIQHWLDTADPRNVLASTVWVPFVLFQRQRELVEFIYACLTAQADGLVEKCRDMGATWLCCAISVWLWLFWPGASVGWGSYKQELVDRLGDVDSIFEKMRLMISRLPLELLPYDFSNDNLSYMRIVNPENGATITGAIGDNIGRGGRKLIMFKDESAHYEHAEMIEAALTDNTRVQIDVSSVCGLGTVFHRKREAGIDWVPGQPALKGKTNVFVLDWRDHPLKTQGWYDQRREQAKNNGLLHIFAQEVDRNYAASVEGVIIPAEWVKAAIDAHVKLGFDDSGGWVAALDVADEGGDTNALAKRKGIVLKSVEEWGERDTGATARRAVDNCRGFGRLDLQYDCIGIGAGIKAETNRLGDEGLLPRDVHLVPWNAGAEVQDKDGHVIPFDNDSPINGDFYANLKAQAWWQLRRRFETTWRAVRSRSADATPEEKSFTWKVDDLISLPSTLPLLRKIEKELSQATAGRSSRMKLIVDKAPDGMKSPNLADAIVMCYWPITEGAPFVISDRVLTRAAMGGYGQQRMRRF